tara:strand:+ start:440 stop:790 length:351 start_codon:yes stop_codon:yes gene_type:complete
MANPQAVVEGIQKTVMKLATKSNDYPELLTNAAEAEREYKILRRQKAVELQFDGEKATMITILCEGNKAVACAKFEWAKHEAIAKGCKESIASMTTAIVALESILAWERKVREMGP